MWEGQCERWGQWALETSAAHDEWRKLGHSQISLNLKWSHELGDGKLLPKRDCYVASTCVGDYYGNWSLLLYSCPAYPVGLAMWLDLANNLQLAFYNHSFHIPRCNQLWTENIFLKSPGKSQKAKPEFSTHQALHKSTWMKQCVGIPCCSLYANIVFMQISCHFI